MAKTSAIVTYTDQTGKAMQKALTDINPDATNAQLVAFAQKLTGITSNSYVSTLRVDKVNCDSEAGGGDARPVPTLAFNDAKVVNNEISVTTVQNNGPSGGSICRLPVTYNGDGTVHAMALEQTKGFVCCSAFYYEAQSTWAVGLRPADDNLCTEDVQIKVWADETENYKAAEPIILTVKAYNT